MEIDQRKGRTHVDVADSSRASGCSARHPVSQALGALSLTTMLVLRDGLSGRRPHGVIQTSSASFECMISAATLRCAFVMGLNEPLHAQRARQSRRRISRVVRSSGATHSQCQDPKGDCRAAQATWLECAANLPKHADTLARVGLNQPLAIWLKRFAQRGHAII